MKKMIKKVTGKTNELRKMHAFVLFEVITCMGKVELF